jgi:hypothetical protein
MANEIKVLKNFRDNILLTNSLGKSLVDFYYEFSPPVADFIAEHESLRAVVRWSLLPLIGVSWMSLKLGVVPSLLLILLVVGLCAPRWWFFCRRIRLREPMI